MQILQNLVEMTGQRDHLRLEVSVLSTLLQLPHVVNVRALELSHTTQGTMVRPRTWLEGERMVTVDSDAPEQMPGIALAEMPLLERCIKDAAQSVEAHPSDDVYMLWLPVWMHDQAHTCVEITQTAPFTPQAVEVLMGVFRVYQNYQSLLDYSERDALTGLLNRKTFEEQFSRNTPAEASMPASSMQHQIVSDDLPQQWLAVLDIDHFKQVNDRYGHLFGDEVLILVANLLRTSFRSHDRIFRFGGEEFVILLRGLTLADAQRVFERFRSKVEAHEFPQVGCITVSMGFTSTRSGTPVEILGQADQALYYAKQNGRNRVCHYGSLIANGELNTQLKHEDVELF